MRKQTNSKGKQLNTTFENWLSGKVEFEIGGFSVDESKKIHEKSKELIIAEADNRFKKEVSRIEKSLLSAPSKEKFIQSEIDIINRILHIDIDYRTSVVYYKTGRFEYDIKQIESIRHNYRIYLQGEINYIGKTPEIDYFKAENIIEAIKFYRLDEWLKVLRESKAVNKEAGEYVLKNESVILRLFEEFGTRFPGENRKVWKQRFINGNDTLTAINIDEFKNGNNKHLILTVLHEAHRRRLLKVGNMAVYAKKRWGLNSYHTDLSRYLGFDKVKNCYMEPHPELNNITDILKPESF